MGRKRLIAVVAVALLAFSILLGGAAPPRPWPSAGLQLLGLVLMGLAVVELAAGEWRRHIPVLALAAGVALLPLLQLIPLPPDLWSQLPGRAELAQAPALAGVAPGWAPLSLAPDETWAAALGLIPALAIFLACLTLPADDRFRLVLVVLGGATLSLLLGALQLAGGDAFHPHANTPSGAVSGFFVNRNHLAALVLMSLPFAAALAAPGRRWPIPPRALRWLCVLFGLLAVVGLGAIRSRAGVVLVAPAVGLGLMMLLAAGGVGSARTAWGWAAGAGAAALAVTAFGLSPLMARFGGDGEVRFERWPGVLDAAGAHQPLGAGLGAFAPIYRMVEPVADLGPTFFNHAHNDYLELWLETGWPGVLLLAALAVWAARRVWRCWRPETGRRPDVLACAAGGALVLLALHSAVDFPIRTTTILVIAALCLGLIAAAAPSRADEVRD